MTYVRLEKRQQQKNLTQKCNGGLNMGEGLETREKGTEVTISSSPSQKSKKEESKSLKTRSATKS
jgi:hypothetical protein